MIKEFWKIVKMLFASKPNDIKEVELMGMNHFPFSGYKYMMWCGKMIYRNGMIEKRKKEWGTAKFETSKRHEGYHLDQAKQFGSWLAYYWQYFKYWIKGNPIIYPASSAYYTIPFEMEAYANENNPDYVVTKNSWKRYEIKDRKKTYKQHMKDWKQYCKNLKI